MLRLSRARAAVIFAVIFFLGFEALAIYLFVMNRRLTGELVSHSWRRPTVLLSSSGPSKTIATLYGVDWRITPPVTLQSIPAHVSNAFLAAEDVRFHHHIGIESPQRSEPEPGHAFGRPGLAVRLEDCFQHREHDALEFLWAHGYLRAGMGAMSKGSDDLGGTSGSADLAGHFSR